MTTARARLKLFLVAITTVAFIASAGGSARAAGASGAISQVEYNTQYTGNPLMLQLNGNSSVNYFAPLSSPGCGIPALSIDTIKILLSIAQAALLSAKPATIYYNSCGGNSFVYDVVMSR